MRGGGRLPGPGLPGGGGAPPPGLPGTADKTTSYMTKYWW